MNAVRRSGLLLLTVAGAVTVACVYLARYLATQGWQLAGYGWGVPGAFALVGLVQTVSGVPFSELAGRWDDLQGWQRGILGTLIVLVAVSIIIGGLLLFASLMWD